MKASSYDEDTSFIEKLGLGMRHAFVDDNSGIKEYKSSWRNYKKAFNVVYDYLQATTKTVDEYTVSYSYDNIKSELANALKEKSSPAAFYNIIQKYLDNGTALSTVKNAVCACSLRQKLLKISDINEMSNYLSDSELAVIKSALAYEDYMFPYLQDYCDELTEEYQREKAKQNASSYTKSISSILSTMKYNTPTYRTTNNNYNNYLAKSNMYNLLTTNNRYNQNTVQPNEAFNSMMSKANYGVSTDIWGNRTQHYKDGSSYTQKERGINPFTGGNN